MVATPFSISSAAASPPLQDYALQLGFQLLLFFRVISGDDSCRELAYRAVAVEHALAHLVGARSAPR
jgi:hypothetical protein